MGKAEQPILVRAPAFSAPSALLLKPPGGELRGARTMRPGARLRNAIHTRKRGAGISAEAYSTPDFSFQATAEATDYVIIHEANGLHERIADLGAREAKAAPD